MNTILLCIYTTFLIHSYIVTGCFHVSANMNNTTMKMGIQISLSVRVLFPLNEISEVELLHHMVVLFFYLIFRNSAYCFPWCLHQFTFSLTSHGIPFAPHPYQQLLFLIFLIIVILTDVR